MLPADLCCLLGLMNADFQEHGARSPQKPRGACHQRPYQVEPVLSAVQGPFGFMVDIHSQTWDIPEGM